MNFLVRLAAITGILCIAACEHFRPSIPVSDRHIQPPPLQHEDIPPTVKIAPVVPPPRPDQIEPTHTVVVNNVPVRELLFSLARDAHLNLDVDEGVSGNVTLNAVKQPLPAILERVTEICQLYYEIKNNVLRIRQDTPYLHNYRVDYLNLTRKSKGVVSVSTQISATGQGGASEGGGEGGNNNSSTNVENQSDNSFWETLQLNIAGIINASVSEEGVTSNDIVVNRQAGLIAVRATRRQHREIRSFLDDVINSSQRQVLIEATIAEVNLSDRYQAGIDWNLLQSNVGKTTELTQNFTDLTLLTGPALNISVSDIGDAGDALQATLAALEAFGDVSVMSSPKVMAMNNQTALLKVVDNLVYFTIEVDIEGGSDDQERLITYETEIHTVPVGFVMSVTPFVSNEGTVTLNVRPTISRVIAMQRDPNPAIAAADVVNEIPVIQVREVESILKVNDGDIAVMGGLMQDEIDKKQRGIPVLSRIPWLGSLFRFQDDRSQKTELVIFIKPVVISNANHTKQVQQYQRFLPAPTQKPEG